MNIFLTLKIFKKSWFSSKIAFLIFCVCLSSCQLLSPREKEKEKPDKISIDKEPAPPKPKIGLFISGAGASTFSALSLLELFQKKNISFDFIAGSGWGAWLTALWAKNQNVDDIKWNIFKLKEQGVFEKKWFSKKKKKAKLLEKLTKEVLSSPLPIPFLCPALTPSGRVLWLTGKRPDKATLRCLNNVPPLYFAFGKIKEYGSFFSTERALKYIQKKGINTLIWIKPSMSLKSDESDKAQTLFWRELKAYLNNVQKIIKREQAQSSKAQNRKNKNGKSKLLNQIIILKTKSRGFSPEDFSKLNTIMKSPAPFLKRVFKESSFENK